MNKEDALQELRNCRRYALACAKRSRRLSASHPSAADAAWAAMLYWRANGKRENLRAALAR